MAQKPKTTTEIKDFPGLVLNADPDDIPDGAASIQVNACSVEIAQLAVRLGYKVVRFDAE